MMCVALRAIKLTKKIALIPLMPKSVQCMSTMQLIRTLSRGQSE